eukprot:UC4_evm1s763
MSLSHTLKKSQSHITNLVMAQCALEDDGVVEIFDVIAENLTVETVNVSLNKIGPLGAAAIMRTLTMNTHLRKLVISFNNIGPKGAQLVAKGIE